MRGEKRHREKVPRKKATTDNRCLSAHTALMRQDMFAVEPSWRSLVMAAAACRQSSPRTRFYSRGTVLHTQHTIRGVNWAESLKKGTLPKAQKTCAAHFPATRPLSWAAFLQCPRCPRGLGSPLGKSRSIPDSPYSSSPCCCYTTLQARQ